MFSFGANKYPDNGIVENIYTTSPRLPKVGSRGYASINAQYYYAECISVNTAHNEYNAKIIGKMSMRDAHKIDEETRYTTHLMRDHGYYDSAPLKIEDCPVCAMYIRNIQNLSK